jgi:hypothetical protein
MQEMNSAAAAFDSLPRRLFPDSSTLQNLDTYGEYVYDGGQVEPGARILSVPDGMRNLEALRNIMMVGQRAMFELVLSENSLREVITSSRPTYLNWALEVLPYWRGILAGYPDGGLTAFSARGRKLAGKITSPRFGYLSHKDRALLSDALALECDAFITMDRKLARIGGPIERETGLRVLEPTEYWQRLEPWAALWV